MQTVRPELCAVFEYCDHLHGLHDGIGGVGDQPDVCGVRNRLLHQTDRRVVCAVRPELCGVLNHSRHLHGVHDGTDGVGLERDLLGLRAGVLYRFACKPLQAV